MYLQITAKGSKGGLVRPFVAETVEALFLMVSHLPGMVLIVKEVGRIEYSTILRLRLLLKAHPNSSKEPSNLGQDFLERVANVSQ